MVPAGGIGIFWPLKTRKLLISLPAKNAQYYKIAFNWNVSGTRNFHLFIRREKRGEARPVGFEPATSCLEGSFRLLLKSMKSCGPLSFIA